MKMCHNDSQFLDTESNKVLVRPSKYELYYKDCSTELGTSIAARWDKVEKNLCTFCKMNLNIITVGIKGI